MQRLSTGFRINSAKDDAAGLAIANKLTFQVNGLNRASENATHGISLIQTAEGALNEMHNMIQRKRELAVQAANDTNTPEDRDLINREIVQLTDEIHTIANRTEFNRMRILNGEADRVTEGIWRNSALGEIPARGVVSLLYMSEQVPPGSMPFTIEEPGRPAIMEFNTPPSWIAPIDGKIAINGIDFNVKAGENILYALNKTMQFTGIEMFHNNTTNKSYMITTTAGQDKAINITGTEGLFVAMGIGGWVHTPGTDAVIKGPEVMPGEPAELLLESTIIFPPNTELVLQVNGVEFTLPNPTTWGDIEDWISHISGVTLEQIGTTSLFSLKTEATGENATVSLFARNNPYDDLLEQFIDPNTALNNFTPGSALTPAELLLNSPDLLTLVNLNNPVLPISSAEAGILELTVNGVIHQMHILADDTTYQDVFNWINSSVIDVSIPLSGPPWVIRSNEYGKDVTISLNATYANAHGLMDYLFQAGTPNTAKGIDGSHRLLLYDINGQVIPGVNLAASVNGNQVFVRGTGGEDIRFNIQVRVDADNPPNLIYGNVGRTPVEPQVFPFVTNPGFNSNQRWDINGNAIVPNQPGHRGMLLSPPALPNAQTAVENALNQWAMTQNDGTTNFTNWDAWATFNIGTTSYPTLTDALNSPAIQAVLNSIPPTALYEPDNTLRVPHEPLDMVFNFREFGPLRLQIGPSHNNAIDIQIPRLNAETLGLVEYVAGERRPLLLYTTSEGAQAALTILDRALSTVSAARSRLGAFQNRLESTVRSLDVAAENTATSRSRIKDTDMARESITFAQYNVMFQAAQAMLGQANTRPQQLLSLLQ
jgi:flagellin-like hook-associated protein FlgL